MLTHTIEYEDQIFTIKIGQTAQENWDLISSSDQNDVWFHLASLPSPHVVLQNSLKIPQNILQQTALLCKQHSKYKNFAKLSVIYTLVKNVKKASKVGSVTTSRTKSITV